jgi:hypothetical protein
MCGKMKKKVEREGVHRKERESVQERKETYVRKEETKGVKEGNRRMKGNSKKNLLV